MSYKKKKALLSFFLLFHSHSNNKRATTSSVHFHIQYKMICAIFPCESDDKSDAQLVATFCKRKCCHSSKKKEKRNALHSRQCGIGSITYQTKIQVLPSKCGSELYLLIFISIFSALYFRANLRRLCMTTLQSVQMSWPSEKGTLSR